MATQESHLQWVTAPPFWADLATQNGPVNSPLSRQAMRQPALLRFATDAFMDDFLAMLEVRPAQLSQLRAQHETWRKFDESQPEIPRSLTDAVRMARAHRLLSTKKPGATQIVQARPKRSGDLKLYQPAHQRYYLVTGCLVCREPGLPDHVIGTNNDERVSFVVRRLVAKVDGASVSPDNSATYDECALVGGERELRWQRVSDVALIAEGEERLPLFQASYLESDGRKRRLMAGMVPVARREAYVNAPRYEQGQMVLPAGYKLPDARVVRLRGAVIEPWKGVVDRAVRAHTTLKPNPVTDPKAENPSTSTVNLLKTAREDVQTVSWLILLDFAEYLQTQLPKVWAALNAPTNAQTVTLTTAEQALLNDLRTKIIAPNLKAKLEQETRPDGTVAQLSTKVAASLADALTRVPAFATKLERNTQRYDRLNADTAWPNFLFPLSDPEADFAAPTGTQQWGDDKKARVDALADLMIAALPAQAEEPLPPLPLAARMPMPAQGKSWFVIRMVLERPQCLTAHATVISEPTQPFLMAGFFDPDAPARPIRIALPIDTTPAGLRKFDKNTAFMISDVLCGQINRAKGLSLGDLVRSVLPWPLHKDLDVPDNGPCTDGDALGMICSLSIPIITICALILLIIIVNLLDLIFRWVPFFILCFPFPKFEGKTQ